MAAIPKSIIQSSPGLTPRILRPPCGQASARRRARLGYRGPHRVLICDFQQPLANSPTLRFGQLRKFLDDFGCAHGEIIAVIGNLSARLIETFPIGTENKGRRQKAAAFASAHEDSLKGRLVAVVFARRALEFLVNLAKCGAKLGRQKAGWNPRHDEVERINHRRR